ncbi:hypothetical protein ACFWSF_39150 [Streptomyces sp. NPDC058611]|uniref:hypothetical protein n=1 Tax=unclassified Streptomyces TaxID=2593676 RepID=UPI00366952C7
MSESDQDRPERDGCERGANEDERDGCPGERTGGREGAAGGVPAAPPEHLALLADGVVELRKRGGITARRTGPEGPRDGGPAAGEAAARDGHYAAGGGGSDPCLEAMVRRAADRAGRPPA